MNDNVPNKKCIYVLLRKSINENTENDNFIYQQKIMKFLSKQRKQFSNKYQFEMKIVMLDDYIFEYQLPQCNDNDTLLWNRNLASNNLELVKKLSNSVVALDKRTLLTQKVGNTNPINENMAINHNFKLLYMSDDTDITNDEYALVLGEETYTINFEKLINPNL